MWLLRVIIITAPSLRDPYTVVKYMKTPMEKLRASDLQTEEILTEIYGMMQRIHLYSEKDFSMDDVRVTHQIYFITPESENLPIVEVFYDNYSGIRKKLERFSPTTVTAQSSPAIRTFQRLRNHYDAPEAPRAANAIGALQEAAINHAYRAGVVGDAGEVAHIMDEAVRRIADRYVPNPYHWGVVDVAYGGGDVGAPDEDPQGE